MNTRDAVEKLARALNQNPRDAGFAGMKDKDAVTTQWASFAGGTPEQARALELAGIDVLDAAMHPNKLRTGHLRGNRFRLRVRGESVDAEVAKTLLAELERIGAPNYYGDQRFGAQDRNLVRARAWIRGEAPAPRDRFERKLFFSTWQSALFNEWLGARLDDGLYERPVPGDLMRKEDSGGLFVNEDQSEAERRMAAWEISPTGPIFGAEMRFAQSDAEERERTILRTEGVTLEQLQAHVKHGEGTRRAARVRPRNVQVSSEPAALLLEFELPAGAYATMIMRELQKPDTLPRDDAHPHA
jgi:tRNA pseudouridine13 synthase